LQSSCSATAVVQISDDINFSTLIVDEGGLSGNSYSASGLQPNTAYYCRVGTDSCATWSGTVMFTTGLSIFENDNILDVYIYPNPVKDMVGVDFTVLQQADVTIQLLDILGNEIMVKKYVDINSGKHKEELDVAEIPSGIYIMNIDVENNNGNFLNETKRIIKK
jgi:hypothetical protein